MGGYDFNSNVSPFITSYNPELYVSRRSNYLCTHIKQVNCESYYYRSSDIPLMLPFITVVDEK